MEGWELEARYAFNILAMVGFGFFHLAGVMPIARDIGALDNGGVPNVNLMYSHTCMAPSQGNNDNLWLLCQYLLSFDD